LSGVPNCKGARRVVRERWRSPHARARLLQFHLPDQACYKAAPPLGAWVAQARSPARLVGETIERRVGGANDADDVKDDVSGHSSAW